MSKKTNNFSNSFAALALHEEQEPKKVLALQSKRSQKKLEFAADRKPRLTSIPGREAAADCASASSPPDSPGLAAALEAIREAEQQQVQVLQHTNHHLSTAATAGGAVSASRSASLSSTTSDWPWLAATISSSISDSSSDPWGSQASPAHHHHHQQQQQQLLQLLSSADVPPWADCQTAEAIPALSWQRFAFSFAAEARAVGDDAAADGAVHFGLSSGIDFAQLAAADGAAAAELDAIAADAAAAGLSLQQLIEAQQAELLHQAGSSTSSSKGKKGPKWRQVTLDWTNSAGSNSNNNSAACSPERRPRAAAAAVANIHSVDAFPELEGSPGSSWQTAYPSPHSISRHWKGGRMAPKPRGIKVLNSSNNRGSEDSMLLLRPGREDLHWDLVMDGHVKMQRQRENDSSSGGSSALDAWGGLEGAASSCAWDSDVLAVERTRQLLAEQEASAGTGSSNRDKLGQDTMRRMMEKAANKSKLSAADGSSVGPEGEAAEEQEAGGVGGAKSSFGYDWGTLFKSARSAGWEPVGKAEGGGGSHFKLRRVLPISKLTQTMMIACTPSDSQRGVKNAAAAFKRKEDEKIEFASRAVAAASKGASDGRTRPR